jgi:PPM family protein phosphatase
MALFEKLEFFARTDAGRKRKQNEDNFLVDADLRLFVVADGMGGHAAGEVASAIAVRTVHEVVRSRRDLLQDRNAQGPRSEVSQREILGLLEYAVQEASRRVHADAQTDARKRGMGTTLSLLLLLESSAYVAHVGDSRVYLVRGGATHQITEDHTIANELIRLGIVAAEAVHNVPNRNAITRAVGVYEHVEVDTLTIEVLPEDQFVLASDGLCGYLDEKRVSLAAYLEDADGERIVGALVGFANDLGGKDNITVLLVRVGRGDVADTARAERLALKREMLGQMPLFSRLSEREVLRVMQVAEVFELEAGESVVRQGEPGDRMFVALQGRLQVSTKGAVLGELGPGEHFGEMSLIRSRPRSADVMALEPSALITIKREDFFELIRTEHRIAVKLLWQFVGVLANRLERTSRELSVSRGEHDTGIARRPWIEDEPSLDPFDNASARSSFMPSRAVTLPGIDDDLEPPPLSSGDGRAFPKPPAEPTGPAAIAQRNSPSRETATPKLSDAPALAAQRDAIVAQLAREQLDHDETPVTRRRSSPGPAPQGGPSQGEEPPPKRTTQKMAATEPPSDPEDDISSKRTIPTTRPRNETLKSADPAAGRSTNSTRPDGGRRSRPAHQPGSESPREGFQPTKRTLPLRPTDDFQDELAELRKEFKERLARARKEREDKK